MQYLYVVVIGAVILAICYLSGRTASLLKININPFIFGFVLLNVLFYVTAFPFMFFNGKLSYLTAVYVLLILFVIAAALILMKKKGTRGWKSKNALKNMRPLLIPSVIIAVQIVLSFVLAHHDADDSYYIARTSAILHTGGINVVEPSTGLAGMSVQPQYSMVGYEVMMAVLCKIFGVNAAFMSHTAVVPVLLILHYIVMYELGKEIFPGRAHLFLSAIVIINIFSGYSVYSRGAFAMLRIWQGKAVMVNIVMPVMVLVFAAILKSREIKAGHCAFLTMLLIGGLNFSTVAVYLLPVQYAMFSSVYVLAGIKSFFKNISRVIKLILPAVIELPFVCIIYFFQLRGGVVDVATEGIEAFSYMDVLGKINGCRYTLIFVIITVMYFCIFERGCKRLLFGVYPLICACTALNPFLSGYIAKYITGVPVYWRLFWILGMSYMIAAMLVSLYCRKELLGVAAAGFLLSLSGHIIYTPDNFSLMQNMEKIEAVTHDVADAIEEENVGLMLPEHISYGIRQYRGEIKLVWSRYSEALYNEKGNYEPVNRVYNILYTERLCPSDIIETLLQYGADYVLLYQGTELSEGAGTVVWSNDEYVLYQLNGASAREKGGII